MITVICYDTIERWKSKKKALGFYRKGAIECDGSESERYTNIVWDIMDGKKVCTDGYSDINTKKHFIGTNGTDIRDGQNM